MYQQARCKSCMYGTIVNGVCNHCGKPVKGPADRRADALPLDYLLGGRYYIGDVLGSGGFGITYAAWDQQENCRVAVKELFPTNDVSRMMDGHSLQVRKGQENYFAKVSECFCNEAKLLIQLRDIRGIVGVYNLFPANGTFYYVMEFLDGSDLKGALKAGPLSWQQLAPIMAAMVEALDRLHQCNLIHRDISPDNIFLTRNGETRLIDFGTVRTYQGNKSFTVYIKPSFAPMEQWQSNGKQGPWTDVYALCVTMYYCLSGVLPPKAPDRALNRPIRHIGELCPTLPSNVAEAIHKGMGMYPHERHQNMRELGEALFGSGWNQNQQGGHGGHGGQSGQGHQNSQGHQSGQGHHGNQGQQFVDPQLAVCGYLVCVKGVYQGSKWPLQLGLALRLGRQPACEIAYPLNTPGVSGFHCTVLADDQGQLWIRDDKSSYGTRLDGEKLQPLNWYPMGKGAKIFFGQEYYLIQ